MIARLEHCQDLGKGRFQVRAVKILQTYGREFGKQREIVNTFMVWNYTKKKSQVIYRFNWIYNNPYDFLKSTGFHDNTGEHCCD